MVPILVVWLIYLGRPSIICVLGCERLGNTVVLSRLLILILHTMDGPPLHSVHHLRPGHIFATLSVWICFAALSTTPMVSEQRRFARDEIIKLHTITHKYITFHHISLCVSTTR
jgi:hypothetical protein